VFAVVIAVLAAVAFVLLTIDLRKSRAAVS
jgi:hypothetical protein